MTNNREEKKSSPPAATNSSNGTKSSPPTATNSSNATKSSPPASSRILEAKDDHDGKFSPLVAPVAVPPAPSTTSTLPLEDEQTNWKKRAAGARTTRKKKDSFSEEHVNSIESSSHTNFEEMSPDLPVGTNYEVGSVDNNRIMDDDHTEPNMIALGENPLSSPIFAAELVENDEEAGDVVPGGNLWENTVHEEFQTRLLTLEQNLVVAEVVTKQSNSRTKRRWRIWGLLLTLVVLASAIVAGVVTSKKSKQAASPQHVTESREQKQGRLQRELTQQLYQTNSDNNFKPFEDPSSPQSLALEWLLNDNITLTENTVTQKVLDRYVLAVLYYSTDGPQWQNNVGSSFLLEQDICDWNTDIPWSSAEIYLSNKEPDAWTYLVETQNETAGGVYCEGPQDEIQLSLNSCGLNGTLPWELSLLSNVVSIQLTGNEIGGTIPAELGQLSTLIVLMVWSNSLTGTMPTELGYLTAMTYLGVDSNSVSGTLPTELGRLTALRSLEVSSNMFTGTLPTELGLLTALQHLYAYYNTLTGTLPTLLGLLTGLQDVWIDFNTLTGTLPTELGTLTAMQAIRADNNMLTGTQPTELGLLTALQEIRVDNNMLTGMLPTELGQLTALLELEIYDNVLTGTIPTEMGRLINLVWLNMENNKLTGPLPTELGQLTALSEFRIFNNALTGTLPTEMDQMVSLELLDVSNNLFTGTVPSNLAENLRNNFLFDGNNFTAGN